MRGRLLSFVLVSPTTPLHTTLHATEDDVHEAPDDLVAPKHLQPGDDHGGGSHDTHHQRLIRRQNPQVAQIQHADRQPAEHAQGDKAERKAEACYRTHARVPLFEHREVPAGWVSGLWS